MASSERIVVLLTAAEKRRIAKQSRAAGISMEEFIRRAAAAYRPATDDNVLNAMLDQLNKSTARASAAVDRALAYIAKSNTRIARLERNAGQ